jgi:20S proteasome alpha/beta subunit
MRLERTHRGTSVIAITTADGVVVAANDLVYADRDGQAVPVYEHVQKVVTSGGIIVGMSRCY